MGRHALLVATGEYSDVRLSRLRAPGQDVERLAAVLEDPDVGGFTSVEVLRDRPDDEVRRAVEDLLAPRAPDDLVLLYFSCHGLVTPQRRLYFAAANTVSDRPAGTAIPRSFLNEQLEDCRAAGRVLVLDCCFSGAFVEGFKGEAAVLDDVGEGYVVMTASNAYEYAFEQDSLSLDAPVASLFTDVLIEGLAGGGADLDGDGWVDVAELFRYAREQVRVRRPDQTPQFFAHGASAPVRIARAGAPSRRVPRRAASYTAGQLLVLRGFRAAADPVCRTLGPMGRRAVVFVDGRPEEMADSSAIVAAYRPDDPRDSLGASYVRELVEEVRREAGDGAASAVAVARGALGGLVEAMREGHNPVRLMRGVEAAAARAVELVGAAAVPLGEEDVRTLATTASGSERIGAVVATVSGRVGWRGPVLVEEGRGFGLEFEIGRGLRIDAGYASGGFVTDPVRREVVLDNPVVLLHAGYLTDDVIREMPDEDLLVVCEGLSHEALVALLRPGGERAVAAVVVDPAERTRLARVVLDRGVLEVAATTSRGRAGKAVVTAHDTVVFTGWPSDEHPAGLIRAGGAEVGVVERAVRAVRGAATSGVIRGGGVALAEVGARVAAEATGTEEEVAGWRAFAAALAEPSARIAENAALAVADLDPSRLDSAGTARVVVAAAARTASRFLLVA
ncbi:caspase, EACC1-associated type [Saccharothrix syringae]|uniref:caspase, EACC1-associated type n=1 Tax=Saccharothrix syringae TaxID=103733 RepID=UPI000691CA6A|nr:TCP-1/cpn60 chaperonin family protein [Saccharothrix syringae]